MSEFSLEIFRKPRKFIVLYHFIACSHVSFHCQLLHDVLLATGGEFPFRQLKDGCQDLNAEGSEF